jgi:hypothetical protein
VLSHFGRNAAIAAALHARARESGRERGFDRKISEPRQLIIARA